MTLKKYRERRPEGRSPEPRGRAKKRRGPSTPHFVIQHHAASTDHYDFRLEMDGVLASWAVPKGPSVNPKDKRMARRTEDHSMEYEDKRMARRKPVRSQPESVLSGKTLDELS